MKTISKRLSYTCNYYSDHRRW